MARPREIPCETDWLRGQLKRRFNIDLPLDVSGEEAASICAAVPTKEWAALSLAWRQHNHRNGGVWARMNNKYTNEGKRLGWRWERLIREGFVRREDALVIAAKAGGGFAGWCDASAKYLIKGLLQQAADNLRKFDPARNKAQHMGAAMAWLEKHGTMDAKEMHRTLGLPLDVCLDAVSTFEHRNVLRSA
jgi:hypothetical protein